MTSDQTRVVIDLNDFRESVSMVLLDQVSGPIHVGDTVLAVEPESGVSAPAVVTRINLQHGFALVRVQWQELREDPAAQLLE